MWEIFLKIREKCSNLKVTEQFGYIPGVMTTKKMGQKEKLIMGEKNN